MWDPDEVEQLAGRRVIEEDGRHVFTLQNSFNDILDDIDDRHSVVSWMAGMVGPFRFGASACLEERWMPDSVCLSIRTTLRIEKIDPQIDRK